MIHVLIRDVEREEAFNLRLAGIISYYLFLVKRDDGALREVERELTAKSENGGDIFALLLLNSSEEIIMFSGRPPASVAHNLRRFRSRPSLPLSLSLAFSPFGIANYRSARASVRVRGCLEALLTSPLKSPHAPPQGGWLQGARRLRDFNFHI